MDLDPACACVFAYHVSCVCAVRLFIAPLECKVWCGGDVGCVAKFLGHSSSYIIHVFFRRIFVTRPLYKVHVYTKYAC